MEKLNQITPEVEKLNEQEKQARVEFFLREELAGEYDDTRFYLKDALRYQEEVYKKSRQQWVDEQIDFYHETEDLNALTEKAFAEAKVAKINPVTGLENRPGLFIGINSHLKNIFSPEVLADRDKFFSELKTRDFSQEELKVLFCDVSFLSLANEVGGHEMGDELLKNMADQIRTQGSKAVHYGGDELVVLYNADDDLVEKSIARIEAGVKNLEIDYLKELNLQANMDKGLATLPEAIDVFNEMIDEVKESPEGREALKLMHPVKALENIFVALADKRAFLQKGLVRIPLLINIKKKSQAQYEKVIGSLRKGAYSATDKELDALAEVEPSERKKAIKEFILSKEKENLESVKNEFDYLRSSLILKKALNKF
jgi:diguanylate cyclase (GGDEF)-like protein